MRGDRWSIKGQLDLHEMAFVDVKELSLESDSAFPAFSYLDVHKMQLWPGAKFAWQPHEKLQGIIHVNNSLIIDQNSYFEVNSAHLQANLIAINGSLAMAVNSCLVADKVTINGLLKADKSAIKTTLLTASVNSKINCETVDLSAKNSYFFGHTTIQKSAINSESLSNKGTLLIQDSRLNFAKRFISNGELTLEHSELETDYLNLDGQYQLNNCSVATKLFRHQGNINTRNTLVNTNHHLVEHGAHGKMVNSDIQADNISLDVDELSLSGCDLG